MRGDGPVLLRYPACTGALRPAVGVRAAGLRAPEVLRRLTVRLPHRVLRALAAPLAAVLYGVFVVPGALGKRRSVRRLAALPLSVYRGKPLRALWLDTFDRLGAPVEHRYTCSELGPWFDRTGLEVLAAREDVGSFVVVRRPGAEDSPTPDPQGPLVVSPEP